LAERSRWPRGLMSRSWPLGRWDSGFESRWDMDVCLLCVDVVLCSVDRGLCDKLMSRPKDSYPVSNKIQKPKKGDRKMPIDVLTRKKKTSG
jgi:hypothetical protein